MQHGHSEDGSIHYPQFWTRYSHSKIKKACILFWFPGHTLTCAFSLLYCFSTSFIIIFLTKSPASSFLFLLKMELFPWKWECVIPLMCCCSVWYHKWSMQMENPALLLLLWISESVCRCRVSREHWQFIAGVACQENQLLQQYVSPVQHAQGEGLSPLLSLPISRVCINTLLSHTAQEILYRKPESSAKDSIGNRSINKRTNNYKYM